MLKKIAFDTSLDGFQNLPDLRGLGFARASLVTGWGLYRKVGGEYDLDHIDMETAKRAANHPTWWKGRESDMIVLDEEALELHSDDLPVRDHQHDQLIECLQIYRQAHPGNAIGYYSRLPQRWPAFSGNEDASIAAWRARNRQFLQNVDDRTLQQTNRGLAAHVDRVFPSLYWWYELPGRFDDYTRFVDRNLEEAAIYNKPVFAYLCPQQQQPGFAYWQPGVWRRMLEYVLHHSLVDGVVIHVVVNADNKQWNDRSDWWIETQEVAGALA